MIYFGGYFEEANEETIIFSIDWMPIVVSDGILSIIETHQQKCIP
jgi:hypothetical protein